MPLSHAPDSLTWTPAGVGVDGPQTRNDPSRTMSPTYLFVYGSLLTGSGLPVVDRLLPWYGDDLGAAAMRGRLYRLSGYPGALPFGGRGDRVFGRVFRLRGFRRVIRRLDAYEAYFPQRPAASEFIRAVTVVTLLDPGRRVPAWVYLYNGSVRGRRRIYSGDYSGVGRRASDIR